jgi:hypothetical protein
VCFYPDIRLINHTLCNYRRFLAKKHILFWVLLGILTYFAVKYSKEGILSNKRTFFCWSSLGFLANLYKVLVE